MAVTRGAEPAEYTGTIVVGGGTAGAVVAARLVEGGDEVLLLEAGPDYGVLDTQTWPPELLDASRIPVSHQWGFNSGDAYAGRRIEFERARVIGGCSSHNGCAAIWGNRLAYDSWEKTGNTGWSTNDLLPFFRRVMERLRVRIYERDELTPFQRGLLEAAPTVGIPIVRDLNDLDQDVGVGANPVNIVDGTRWNTSFGYLDPVRSSPRLRIAGDALVDRVLVDRERAYGVELVSGGAMTRVLADRIVLAGGAYGSPAVLLRSGIGDPEDLSRLNIRCTHPLAGVGSNLHDHPAVAVEYQGSETLSSQTDAFARAHWTPDEQVIAKARSRHCGEAFDLHIFGYSPRGQSPAAVWRWNLIVACLTPRSRGRLMLRSSDPGEAPLIDHGYLTDEGEEDAGVLLDGVDIARQIGAASRYSELLGPEVRPGGPMTGSADVRDYIRMTAEHYYHPVGTCKMGPQRDPAAVVGSHGEVHGLRGLYVADASIMPTVPRGNTNVPAAVVAERISSFLM